MLFSGIVRIFDGKIHGLAAGGQDVRARRVEVHIIGDEVTGLDQRRKENVLGGAPLMGGHKVFEPEDIVYSLLEAIEAAGAGVGLIALHQRAPLGLAHRARARVRQQINIDIFGAQAKDVVARFAEALLALGTREEPNGLDDFDLIGLEHYPGIFPKSARAMINFWISLVPS
jgi:hypothetical protein